MPNYVKCFNSIQGAEGAIKNPGIKKQVSFERYLLTFCNNANTEYYIRLHYSYSK